MPDKQQTFGQFETPPDVADLLLAFCLRRATDRVLDPSCGAGALLDRAARRQRWLAGNGQANGPPGDALLWGVELETQAAALAQERLPQARIVRQNFFTMEPAVPFDAIVGNPPYTRAEWLDRLQEEVGRQMAMFDEASASETRRKQSLIPARLWNKGLNRRAGLHTYFFLHGARFLREGGRFGFVLPNNWLDVGYGAALKQFLLEQFRLLALIESTVERWFDDARVNTCLVILQKCSDVQERAAQPVRFVQLRRPLAALIDAAPGDAARFERVEALASRLLPAEDRTSEALRVRVAPQRSLHSGEKWGPFWRAPAVYHHVRRRSGAHKVAPLKQWAAVRRGYTTGANDFFYLDAEAVAEWGIEPRFRRPLLKSLRRADGLRLDSGAAAQEVLAIAPTDEVAGTAAARYVAWGESQGYHQRRTCRQRAPWYALPAQEPPALVLPKGIWTRHLAPLLQAPLLVDQQLYGVYLKPGAPREAAAALLNSAWLALQLELHGRVNFGEGVLWLAGYEVQNLLLPDPRYLSGAETDELAALFAAVAARPLAADVSDELARPERQALDRAVFKLVGLSETEGIVVVD
ncbi:MAG TPA: N-6 DNA methylase, partial [Candidatus Sulfomarinibacteraceae bacterium]|nr:N-6 DNA methylase [Candidatus Sulfomarinibacteraceae bacterium]